MFDIGIQEILLILAIALIVVGPKKLPEIGRTIGKSLREFRKASSEVRDHLSLGLDDDDDDGAAPAAGSTWASSITQPPAQRNGSAGQERAPTGAEEQAGPDVPEAGPTP
jgi:sec-independent protein translocase protein TatA